MNTMNYNGYSAVIEFDADDCIFVGHIVGVKQAGGFHADNVKDLKNEFHETVDHYLEICEQRGVSPIKPYSGKITVRVDPSLHAAVARAAETGHTSINKFIASCLANVVHS